MAFNYDPATSCGDFWFGMDSTINQDNNLILSFYEIDGTTPTTFDAKSLSKVGILPDFGWAETATDTYGSATVYATWYWSIGCVAVKPSTVFPFHVKSEDNSGFTYLFDFYSVSAGQEIAASPFYSFIDMDKRYLLEGETCTVTVTLRDNANRFMTTGGDTVLVENANTNSAVFSAVTDNNDGTYTCTITRPDTGYVRFDVKINGSYSSIRNHSLLYFDATQSTTGVDETQSTITISGNEATVILKQSSGANYTATDESSKLRVFASNGFEFGAPTYNNDGTYTFSIINTPANGSTAIVYAFYSEYLISGGFQSITYADPAPAPGGGQSANLPIFHTVASIAAVDLPISHIVYDPATSITSPGNAGIGWPKKSSFTL